MATTPTTDLADTPEVIRERLRSCALYEIREAARALAETKPQNGTATAALLAVAHRAEFKGVVTDNEIPQLWEAAKKRGNGRTRPATPSPSARPTGTASAGVDQDSKNLTDLGNGERFAKQHSKHILYDCASKTWRVWNHKCWAADSVGAVMAMAFDTARSIHTEAQKAASKEQMEALSRWAIRSESREKLNSMVDLARSMPGLATEAAKFDADPWVLNCGNGTLDLRTRELRPFNQADLITRLCPVNYDPDARHEVFDRVRVEAWPDPDLHDYIQRAAGYTLTGSTRDEVLFFVFGLLATMKSTFTEPFSRVMGNYATTADPETFLKKQGDSGVRQDVARLAGMRMVLTSEVDAGKQFAEGLVKRITGGDMMVARFLYGREFTFRPQFKLWLVANHRPRADAEDGALWRRIRVLPFEVSIPKERRDPGIKQAMLTECGPAILAWAIEGCLAWQRDGLRDPAKVETATESYRESQDPLSEFFCTRCHFSPTGWTMAKDLNVAYHAWAEEAGVVQRFRVSPKRLAEALKTRGCQPERFADGRAWRGVLL
jgi:putative DNA primase/helicase